ncbi:hypothetical protein KI387_024438, partial [Taxus chinensis]
CAREIVAYQRDDAQKDVALLTVREEVDMADEEWISVTVDTHGISIEYYDVYVTKAFTLWGEGEFNGVERLVEAHVDLVPIHGGGDANGEDQEDRVEVLEDTLDPLEVEKDALVPKRDDFSQ